jgi:hypothetical protein
VAADLGSDRLQSEPGRPDVRAMLATHLALDRAFLDAELRRRGLEEAWRSVAESE